MDYIDYLASRPDDERDFILPNFWENQVQLGLWQVQVIINSYYQLRSSDRLPK